MAVVCGCRCQLFYRFWIETMIRGPLDYFLKRTTYSLPEPSSLDIRPPPRRSADQLESFFVLRISSLEIVRCDLIVVHPIVEFSDDETLSKCLGRHLTVLVIVKTERFSDRCPQLGLDVFDYRGVQIRVPTQLLDVPINSSVRT